MAVAFTLVAFVVAERAVAGHTWPPEMDHYRDMGAAQVILDGAWGQDAVLKGEPQWYPPLVPLVGAAIAKVTRAPVPVVWARMGPYLDLLAPIAFYGLMWQLLAPLGAVAALTAFLFLGPSWMSLPFQATYSPWVWPGQFAQGLFYLALSCWLLAARSERLRWSILAGLLAGATYLAHAAPALILAVGFAAHTLWLVHAAPSKRGPALRRLAICAGISALVALPAMVPLARQYHFHIRNAAPARMAFIGVGQIARGMVGAKAFLALIGGACLATGRCALRSPEQRAGVIAFVTVAAVLLAYGLGVAAVERRFGLVLPMPVPSFHFHVYLTAFESLFFGLGTCWTVGMMAQRIPHVRSWSRELLTGAVIIALVAAAMPGYLHRRDVEHWPIRARALASDADRVGLYRWIRDNVSLDDIVLAPLDLALYAVTPAGRHSMAVVKVEMSPYVDADRRLADEREMYRLLRSGDERAFQALARTYGVTHVVQDLRDECCVPPWPGELSSMRTVFDRPPIRVLTVNRAE